MGRVDARRAAAAAGLAAAFAICCVLAWYELPREGVFTAIFEYYGQKLRHGALPYRDFSIEYPPGALLPLGLPAFLAAGSYQIAFVVVTCAAGLAWLLLAVASLRETGASATAIAARCAPLAAVPLLLGPLAIERYDFWPAACVAAATAALLAGRPRLGLAALALGTAFKVFPAVLLPLALLYVDRRCGRRAAVRSLAVFVAVLVVVVGPFVAIGPGGVRYSFTVQTGRELQIESVGSSALLVADRLGLYTAHVKFLDGSWNLAGGVPNAVATLQSALLVAALLALWALFAVGPRGNRDLVAAAAATLAAFVVLDKVLSPQFLLWLAAPLVLLARRRQLAAAALLAAAMVLTQLVYPVHYDGLVALHSGPIALLAARNALLLALLALLAAPALGYRRIASHRK